MYRICAAYGLAVLAWCLGLPVRAADDLASLPAALALQEALTNAIRRAEPSIACILVSRSELYQKYFEDPRSEDNAGRLGVFDPRSLPRNPSLGELAAEVIRKLNLADPSHVPESYGSGVVLDEAGLILTNYHVVREATKIFVRLPGDKASYADIHAADPRSDLAVLRLLDPKVLPTKAVRLGDGGTLRKGDFVVSLANPFAAGFRDGSPSASWGIISNVRRRAPGGTREEERAQTLHHYGTLLQTDARLNLGCSGGALLNLRGELVGLTTALAAISRGETAGGFAVPLDAAMKRIVGELLQGEEVEYGFLGVRLKPDPVPGGGVMIESAPPGSPAFQAGLGQDDVLLAVNGQRVRDNDELLLAIGTLPAGSRVRLEVRRPSGTVDKEVAVTLAKFYVPGKIIASNRPPAVRGLRVEFTSVLFQQNSLERSRRRLHLVPPGVYVSEVQPESPAAQARLTVGEVITHVNDQPVHTPKEFYREAAKAGTAKPLELTLFRWDGRLTPRVTLP